MSEAGGRIDPGQHVYRGSDGKVYPVETPVERMRRITESQRAMIEKAKLRYDPTRTLAEQVGEVAARVIALDDLAGDMLATIQLNVERGYLAATSEEGKANLAQLIESWENRLKRMRE